MSLTTNITSLTALNRMRLTGLEQTTAMERLSGGLRINRGADDPSGLAISTGMKARARGLAAASANAQDGLKMLGVMDGTLAEIQNMLMRMRDLTVRASNGAALTDADQVKLQAEAKALRDQIDQAAKATKYNSKDLLYVNGNYQNGKDLFKLSTTNGSISISGDGSTISYAKNNWGGLIFDIYTSNADGTNSVKLVTGTLASVPVNAISNDGTRSIYCPSWLSVVSYNSITKQRVGIGNASGGMMQAALSGDGNKIAYTNVTVIGGVTKYAVFLSDFDGTNKMDLTATGPILTGQATSISINEDGSKVTYYTPAKETYIVDTNTLQNTLISSPNTSNFQLTDQGDKVIYTDTSGGVNQIIESNVDGTNQLLLASGNTAELDMTGKYLSVRDSTAKTISILDTETLQQKLVMDNTTGRAQTTRDSNMVAVATPTLKKSGNEIQEVLQVGADNGAQNQIAVNFEDMGSGSLGVWGVTLTNTDGAQAAITKIDAAIGKVSDKRAEIGILSRRLEHVINDLTAENINTSAARSRIEDADMAAEMTALVRTQLLESTGIQAISLGNEAAKSIMSLLSNM